MQFDLHGHFWTVAPWLLHLVRPAAAPPSSPFSLRIEDPKVGPVKMHGRIRHAPGSKSLLVAVHGLGGNVESHYVLAAARAADQAGLSCLRINLRGAGGGAVDYYHAGLFSDLHAILKAPELDRYERITILGYSLGGHISLRYAASGAVDPRVRGIAAVCPPLDLDRGAAEIDKPERWVYRRHLLEGLKEMYADVATRRAVPVPLREALAIRTLREWDARVVAPRYGFRNAEHYYAEESAGPRLGQITVPSLLVAAEADPMVPAHTLRPALEQAPPSLHVKWLQIGGHVGFPRSVRVGEGTTAEGLEPQVIDWLSRR
jgi:hypothetical protein